MNQKPHSTRLANRKERHIPEEAGRGAGPTRLFLHDVVSFSPGDATSATVPGRDGDIEKALVVASHQDLVCISPHTHTGHLNYLTQLGLGPSSQNIIRLTDANPSQRGSCHAHALLESPELLEEICSKIRGSGPIILEPYIVTPECVRLARELQARTAQTVQVAGGNIDLTHHCIQKQWVKDQARNLGVPVAEGEVVAVERSHTGSPVELLPLREAIKRQMSLNGMVIIKSGIDVLTSTIIKVSGESDSLRTALDMVSQDSHQLYLVEPFYDVTVSPNVLFHIEPERGICRCIGITDQRLSENLAHHGNYFPSSAKTLDLMLDSSQHLSSWLQSEGYSGVVGYDFCEYTDPNSGRPACFFTEMNPRVNGSLYPLSIMARLCQKAGGSAQDPSQAFLSAKWVKVQARTFAEFQAKYEPFFYYPGKKSGIIPFVTNSLDRNSVDFVTVGNSLREVKTVFAMALKAFAL